MTESNTKVRVLISDLEHTLLHTEKVSSFSSFFALLWLYVVGKQQSNTQTANLCDQSLALQPCVHCVQGTINVQYMFINLVLRVYYSKSIHLFSIPTSLIFTNLVM